MMQKTPAAIPTLLITVTLVIVGDSSSPAAFAIIAMKIPVPTNRKPASPSIPVAPSLAGCHNNPSRNTPRSMSVDQTRVRVLTGLLGEFDLHPVIMRPVEPEGVPGSAARFRIDHVCNEGIDPSLGQGVVRRKAVANYLGLRHDLRKQAANVNLGPEGQAADKLLLDHTHVVQKLLSADLIGQFTVRCLHWSKDRYDSSVINQNAISVPLDLLSSILGLPHETERLTTKLDPVTVGTSSCSGPKR